jgi:hypothetical protein
MPAARASEPLGPPKLKKMLLTSLLRKKSVLKI